MNKALVLGAINRLAKAAEWYIKEREDMGIKMTETRDILTGDYGIILRELGLEKDMEQYLRAFHQNEPFK